MEIDFGKLEKELKDNKMEFKMIGNHLGYHVKGLNRARIQFREDEKGEQEIRVDSQFRITLNIEYLLKENIAHYYEIDFSRADKNGFFSKQVYEQDEIIPALYNVMKAKIVADRAMKDGYEIIELLIDQERIRNN